MIKFAAIGLLVLTAACADSPPTLTTVTVCSPETAERRATFIVQCSTAANPHSDEEGEDLVSQCETTATNLFCAEEPALYFHDTYSRVPCSRAKNDLERKVCGL